MSTKEELGKLSSKYESNGKPDAVSSGKGDAGGVSYGCFQFTSIPNGGTVKEFINSTKWHNEFLGLNPGSSDFSNKWKEIANTEQEEFRLAQYNFIKNHKYEPVRSFLLNNYSFNLDVRSHALREVVWSTGVQHGERGGSNVIKRSIERLNKPTLEIKDYDLIKSIYEERRSYKEDGSMKYFSNNSSDVQKGVYNRFINEETDALKILADETNNTSTTINNIEKNNSGGGKSLTNLITEFFKMFSKNKKGGG